MDIDAIGPGVDYTRLIDETIDTIEVVIVVIGQHCSTPMTRTADVDWMIPRI